MNCDEIQARLDAWVDDALPVAEAAAVATHLRDCEPCRAEAAALRALVAQARALPRSVLPGRDLWSGIEARLAPVGGTIRPSPARERPGPAAWRPLLAAAALGGLLLGAALASHWLREAPDREFAREQARYAEASAALSRALTGDATGLAPETRAVVERTLSILDQAIAEAEAALAADPRNATLEQMLLARYQQRLDLLRRAAAVSGSVS
jgi:hypothetical protein